MKQARWMNRILTGVVAASILAAAPMAAHAKKVALLVGIGDYQTMRDAKDTTSNLPVGDLRGPKNDTLALKKVLMDRYGFTTDHVRVILDKEATKDNVLKALNTWLPSQTESGDTVLIYLAGHGTQVLSRGADPNELWDQAFVCTDYSPVSSAANAPVAKRNIIVDNDMGKMLDQLSQKTKNIVLIADCCYAGSMNREIIPGVSRGRWIAPSKADLAKASKLSKASEVVEEVPDSITYIGACADTEQASEALMADGQWHGALSYAIIKNLEQIGANTSYADLMSAVRGSVQAEFQQTPQLITRTPERAVLGGPVAAAAAPAPVAPAAPAATPVAAAPAVPATQATPEVKSDILYVQILNAGKEEAAIREAIDSLGMIKTTPLASAADRVVAIDFKDSLIRAKLALKDGVVEYNAEASTGRELAAALRPFLQKAWLVKIVSSVRSADPSLTPEISINGQSSKNIAVRPVPEAKPALPVIYTGQKAVFSVKPGKDCYLTLVDVGTDGSMTILLPNNIQTQGSKLEAGKVYQIPEPNASYEFVVEPPFGTEMVVAIATKDPIETKSILTESIPAKGGIKAVKDAMDGARLFRVTARTDSEEPAPPAPSPVVVTAAPSAGYATVSQPSDGLLPSDGFGIAFTLVEVKEAK